jgi:hypothetical protein
MLQITPSSSISRKDVDCKTRDVRIAHKNRLHEHKYQYVTSKDDCASKPTNNCVGRKQCSCRHTKARWQMVCVTDSDNIELPNVPAKTRNLPPGPRSYQMHICLERNLYTKSSVTPNDVLKALRHGPNRICTHPFRYVILFPDKANRYGLEGQGIESRWMATFSAPIQAGPGAHPASYTSTRSLSRE